MWPGSAPTGEVVYWEAAGCRGRGLLERAPVSSSTFQLHVAFDLRVSRQLPLGRPQMHTWGHPWSQGAGKELLSWGPG